MTKKKRVLHLVEYLDMGGVERLLYQFSNYDECGVEQVFVAYEMENLKGLSLEMARLGKRIYHYKKSSGHDFFFDRYLRNIIKKEKISILHTHDFGPMEYAVVQKLYGPALKLFHTQHTLHHFLSNWKYRLFFQFAALFYIKVITVSDHVKDLVSTSCPIAKRKLITINNGVSDKFYKKNHLGSSADTTFISVSRISAEKNIMFTLEALKLLETRGVDFNYVHVGDGKESLKEELTNFCTENSLTEQCKFVGYQQDVLPFLRQAKIFISSSLTEGHPVSLLEAMAVGKTCVISKIAAHEFSDDTSSVKFSLDSPVNLANCLEELLLDSKRCSSLALTGNKKAVTEFSFDRMMGSHLDLYSGELSG